MAQFFLSEKNYLRRGNKKVEFEFPFFVGIEGKTIFLIKRLFLLMDMII